VAQLRRRERRGQFALDAFRGGALRAGRRLRNYEGGGAPRHCGRRRRGSRGRGLSRRASGREQQQSNGKASGSVLKGKRDLIRRRCGSCHEEQGDEDTGIKPLPYTSELAKKNKHGLKRPTGAHERIVVENDPIGRLSPSILINFSRPELSPLILGPLAKSAGGYGTCGDVFKDKNDPDYKELLDALVNARALYEAGRTFGSPTFMPNRQYVREMVKYGILPASFDITKDELDVFQTDEKYWRSLWHRPGK